MSSIPEELKYTQAHEWIKTEDDFTGVCGITDHAQEMLTDIVFVELPEVDTEVNKGDQIAVVESVKAVSDMFAPVSGRITEVNTELEDAPELINSDPYEQGWIFKIDIKHKSELDELMDAEAYTAHVESEQ
ncbi:MAG: glycine cleavage system protein GcvH [bacterium]|nr:glycine cleavage system protein GcvH [bacterium]